MYTSRLCKHPVYVNTMFTFVYIYEKFTYTLWLWFSLHSIHPVSFPFPIVAQIENDVIA